MGKLHRKPPLKADLCSFSRSESSMLKRFSRVNNEKESGVISLDTMIRGTCEKRKLLDFVENCTLFDEHKGELTKLIAKNHEFLGVTNAIVAARTYTEGYLRTHLDSQA